jgi:hypothetical protein
MDAGVVGEAAAVGSEGVGDASASLSSADATDDGTAREGAGEEPAALEQAATPTTRASAIAERLYGRGRPISRCTSFACRLQPRG